MEEMLKKSDSSKPATVSWVAPRACELIHLPVNRLAADSLSGSFLLVNLNTEYLVDADSEREVEDSIKSIRAMSYELCGGSGRDESREQVLDRVFGRNIKRLLQDSPQSGRRSRSRTHRAKLILRFVRDAERTLTLVELCHALDSSHRNDDAEMIMGADLAATNHCMGLIKVDQDQKVQFFHIKLREYLKSHYLQELQKCDLELGISCLKYISMNAFSSGWCEDSRSLADRQASYPFVDYASKYWATHLKRCVASDQASFEHLALSFLRNAAKVQASWQMCMLEVQPSFTPSPSTSTDPVIIFTILMETNRRVIADYKPHKFSGLHLLCNFGFHSLLAPLIQILSLGSVNDEDGRRWRPLLFATRAESERCVSILLDAGADAHCPDLEQRSPLHVATLSGNTGIVRMLIESNGKVDANAMTLNLDDTKVHLEFFDDPRSSMTLSMPGMTALHAAACQDNPEMVKILLSCKGLDAGILTTHGMTAFHLAAKCGNLDVLKCLAPFPGVNPRQRSSDGRTALHLAAKYKHLDAVKYLTSLDPVSWYVEDNDCLTVDETMAWFCNSDDMAEKILSIKPATTPNRVRTSEECRTLLLSTAKRLRSRLEAAERNWRSHHVVSKRAGSLPPHRELRSRGTYRGRRRSLPPGLRTVSVNGLTRSRSLPTIMRKPPKADESLTRSESQSAAANPRIIKTTEPTELDRYKFTVPSRIWQSRIRRDCKSLW
jgi:ankyrin repeat protein